MMGGDHASRLGAPGADIPLHVALRTTDVDEARAFCRKLFYGPLQVAPVGGQGGEQRADPRQQGSPATW